MKKTSKFLAILLSVCLLSAFLPAVSFADDTGEWAVLSADHSTLTFCVGTRTETGVVRTCEPENVPGTVFEPTVLHGNYNFTTLLTGLYAPWSDYAQEITKVSFLDTISPDSTDVWFCDFMSLSEITGIEKLDTSHVNDMGYMFMNCSSLTELDVSHFNTENVMHMAGMFSGCSGLTELDVSGWETGNVILFGMVDMFSGCSGLTELDVSGWETGNVGYFRSMFFNCYNLTSLDVSNWDTSNVREMTRMFYNCSSLTLLDVSNWDTSNVVYMDEMFYKCSSLTELDVSDWDTVNVTTMEHMFDGCSCLTELDVSRWNTWKVERMNYLFFGCSGLTALDIGNWNTVRAINLSSVFSGCSGLTALDVGSWNTARATNMYAMFQDCSGLTTLKVSGWNTGNVTDLSSIFNGCSGLSSLNLSGWNTGKVTTMSAMFSGCSNLESLDLSEWDTGKVTAMFNMFSRCSKLSSLNMDGWNTESVTDMSGLFFACRDLSTLTLGERFVFAGYVDLPSYQFEDPYTGYWVSEDHPGLRISSYEFPQNYNGATMAGTWKWETFKDLNEAAITVIPDQEYTGSAIIPAVTVRYRGVTLTEDTDYTLSYNNNTAPGQATVTVTGINSYSGSIPVSYNIVRSLSGTAVVSIPDQEYTGSALTPDVTVTLNGSTLSEGTDYDLVYVNNTEPGAATVIVTGKNFASGMTYGTFRIAENNAVKTDLADAVVTVADQTFTGSALTPAVTVTLNGSPLDEGTDFTIRSYERNTDVGTAVVFISGVGDYEGVAYGTFLISENVPAKTDLSSAAVTAADQDYTGSVLTPAVTVTLNGNPLTDGTDYNLVYVNNTDPGAATVIITGAGDYEGMAYGTFKIIDHTPVETPKTDLSVAAITVADQDYTGYALTPAVTVTVNGDDLTEGTDYSLVYVNNTEPGAATVIVTGMGDYTGMAYETFRINGEGAAVGTPKTDLSDALVTADDQTYTGEALTPEALVSLRGSALREGTDYRTVYINNTETGTAIVVVAGVGDYTGMSYGTFEITKEGEDNPEESGNLLRQFSILDVMKRLFQSIVNAFNKLG